MHSISRRYPAVFNFQSQELERERTVIQEIGQANDTPDDLCSTPKWLPGAGFYFAQANIASKPWATCARDRGGHMHAGYTGDRMVLSAAGNLDHDEIVAKAERLFNSIPETVTLDGASTMSVVPTQKTEISE